jgi:hypothetical protein
VIPCASIAQINDTLYFTANYNNTIYRITTSGAITPLGVATGLPDDLQNVAIDNDTLCFAEGKGNKVGRISTHGGFVTEYAPHGFRAARYREHDWEAQQRSSHRVRDDARCRTGQHRDRSVQSVVVHRGLRCRDRRVLARLLRDTGNQWSGTKINRENLSRGRPVIGH